MAKLAPAQALIAVEASPLDRADGDDATTIAGVTAALARLHADGATQDGVAEYELLSERADCYTRQGDTAAAEVDLLRMASLARQLDDLPRQLAVATRLYDNERRTRLELEQRLAARATELEIINGIGQALAQKLELQAVIDLVGDKIRESLRPETIDIRLYDKRTNLIHTPYQYDAGHRIIKQPFPLGRGLTSRVIESRRPLLLATDAEAQALGAIQTYRDPNDPDEAVTESFLGVPIIVGDEVIGALDVQSYQQYAYGEADVLLLTTLASSMGVAIQNTRLFEAERQRAAELETINDLSQVLATQHDFQSFIDLVGDKLRAIFDVALVFIALYDRSSGRIYFPYYVEEGVREYPEPTRIGEGLTSIVINTRKPLRLPTFEQQRALGVLSDGRPAETWLGVPIFVGEEVIGVVSLQSFQQDDFPEADVRLLTTLTANIGVALDNARLFEAERQRAAELETINRIGQALSAQLELGALIEMVGDTMHQIFNAQNVYVALYDREKGRIDFPYDVDAGHRIDGASIKLGEGLTSRIIQTRQPLLLNRPESQPAEAAGAPLGTPARSFLGVPIIVGDDPIGVISVQNIEREGVFGEADVRLLTTIAANVGVAIQNARLYEEARRRANEMAALAEIGHDIATTVDLEPVLERIIAKAKQLLRVRDIALYMRDPDGRTFPPVVVLGTYVEAIRALPIVVGRGIIGHVAKTTVAEVVNQPELDPRTVRIPGTPLPAEELEALMCAPLLSRGQVIGLLGVWRPRSDGAFTQADLDFLISVARQAAIAIESARLYLETRRQANEMAALADVGRDVSATLDLPTVLERIASHARELLAADTSAVFLAEPGGAIFRAIVVLGEAAAEIQRYPVPLGVGIIGDLALRGVAEVINDTGSDPRAVEIPGTQLQPAERMMVAPLVSRKQVIGLMTVWRMFERTAFTAADLNFLVGLARQATIAIENARLFEETQQARQVADAANMAKSTFLANMSHELRTPLNAVLGFAQVMERDPALSSRQKEHLSIITRSGEHLLGLINDVLEMSKIEAGRITLNEATFDLRRLLQSVEEMFRLRAEAKRLQLAFELAEEVPQFVRGDEGKLRQVLINLLGNAIKFTYAGGVTLRAAWRDQRPRTNDQRPKRRADSSFVLRHSSLAVEVEDTGEGIAADQLPSLFEPFRQTASGIKAQEGTGLGLSISRQFVRLMGGDIRVDSVAGQGTVFAFDVRLAPAERIEMAGGLAERRVIGIANDDRRAYRMLVADDKRENRRLLVEWLEAAGFVVREAANGQEAIAIWEEWAPQLIWMDVRMPILDGYEATRRIKASPAGQTTVIIALTASAFEHEQEIVRSAGCDDVVRKPVREATIFAKIAEHLGIRFIYENPPPVAVPERVAELEPADLADLPAEWLAKLRQAADEVDADLAGALIEQIRGHDAALADGLADLVSNYRFDKLQLLIQEVSADHDPHKHG
ncbi:MAG TPA: GAF domain-containing protein [Roseiflexaceae bacterium]|nr:GAF domain-containing protein [Roseiflexaceae bacterium]